MDKEVCFLLYVRAQLSPTKACAPRDFCYCYRWHCHSRAFSRWTSSELDSATPHHTSYAIPNHLHPQTKPITSLKPYHLTPSLPTQPTTTNKPNPIPTTPPPTRQDSSRYWSCWKNDSVTSAHNGEMLDSEIRSICFTSQQDNSRFSIDKCHGDTGHVERMIQILQLTVGIQILAVQCDNRLVEMLIMLREWFSYFSSGLELRS